MYFAKGRRCLHGKILILDIEWNAKDGSQNIADWEPIQVAAIGTDDKFNILKKFSKRVGLEDISTLTAKPVSSRMRKGRGEFGKASL